MQIILRGNLVKFDKYWACEVTQLAKAFSAKPCNLNLIPETHMVEVENPYKLASDLHKHIMAGMPTHIYTINK